jgi:hypothetical protein
MQQDAELPKKAMTPGPGTYNAAYKSWIKASPAAPLEPNQPKAINWVKVATAPSIPAPAQSYGYEEGPKGELVQQRAPNVGHTGMNSDSPGPGQYEPDVSITRKALSTATFAKGKQGRDCFNMAKDSFSRPGPGQYETGLVTEDEVVRPSPVFLSATTRDKKAKEGKDGSLKHETPGPGSYQYQKLWRTQDDMHANVPEHMQAFGSTSKKLFVPGSEQHPVQVRNPHIPGPGTYDSKGIFTRSRDKSSIGEAGPVHGAFSSTAQRFTEGKNTSKATPGPGYYANEKSTMASNVQHKIVGRYGVFGTTSQRFPVSKQDDLGPGAYEDKLKMDNVGPRKKDPRSHIFASKTKRSGPGAAKDTGADASAPAVGSYTLPPPDWVKKSGSCADSLMNTAPRFKEAKKPVETPGPGYYDTKHNTLDNKVQGNEPILVRGQLRKPTYKGLDRTGVQKPYGSQSARFRVDPNSEKAPGPGWYDEPNTLIKKTFNITIGDSWS